MAPSAPYRRRVASPSLADTVVARIADAYRTHRDPARAPGMEAYMRRQFPFLGLPTPERRRLARDALVGLPRPSDADLVAVARRCWALPEREFQYFACDYLRTHAKRASAAVLADVAELIVTKSWWDTVDGLATQTAGTLVAQHRELVETMDAWISADNMWLARTAILHQLRFRDATDVDRLFRYCLARAGDDEFFIRKAIGWALREYSKTDGEGVRRFVAARAGELSPLSRREAMAWLDRRTPADDFRS